MIIKASEVTNVEKRALNMIQLAHDICAMPPKEATAKQVHLTDIGELKSMHRAAVLNYKLSLSEYDKGRMEAFAAAVERLEERRY